MLTKMSPERSVTAVRLVEAAAQLFARNGFKATTTREIAQLAELNEVTLFRYFPRKADLFLAALESHLSRIKMSRDLQISLAGDDGPEVVVPKVVRLLVNVLTSQAELQLLLYVATIELSEANEMIREHLGPIFDLLCGYFKRSMALGNIKDIEPSVAVFSLVGIVAAHYSLSEIFAVERLPRLDVERAITTYVDTCLNGILRAP